MPVGPRSPIEFCRISRDGRLSLVIDASVGANCTTYSAASSFDNIDAATENLRYCEGMPNHKGVGFTVLDYYKQSEWSIGLHPETVKRITVWANENNFDAVIWTALRNNFEQKVAKEFSVMAALQYLESLKGNVFDVALAYIRRAPPEVWTPVREAVKVRWPA
jgi:hypothetical protein